MNFFEVTNKTMPWGDYGVALLEGHAFDIDSTVVGIHRTGPFVPPIVVSSNKLIVTKQFKQYLENSNLKGISFKICLKQKIVNIPWHTWNNDTEPAMYPVGGEPENYIEKRKHDAKIADKMPELFELFVEDEETLIGRIFKNNNKEATLFLIENTWSRNPIFRSKSHSQYFFVNEEGRSVLDKGAEGFLCFEQFLSREGSSEEIENALEFIKPWWEKKVEVNELSDEMKKNRDSLLKKASASIKNATKAKTEPGTASRYSTAFSALRKAHNIEPLNGDDRKNLEIVLKYFGYI